MSTLSTLEEAHRRAAAALGQLSLAIQRRRFSRALAERCVREWREAADRVEREILGR